MLNPEPFDCLNIGRYTVVRVRFYFPGDSDLKLFVVLNHVIRPKNSYCNCLKATSKTALYESNPEMLAGNVLYKAGTIAFFPKDTVIQTSKMYPIGYEHFERAAKNHEFRIEGKMPADFHANLVSAIKNSSELNEREKAERLEAIDAKQ